MLHSNKISPNIYLVAALSTKLKRKSSFYYYLWSMDYFRVGDHYIFVFGLSYVNCSTPRYKAKRVYWDL